MSSAQVVCGHVVGIFGTIAVHRSSSSVLITGLNMKDASNVSYFKRIELTPIVLAKPCKAR